MIIFEKNLNTGVLLNAYNNNIVRLYSDSSLLAKKCKIIINTSPEIVIHPSPDNKFYFNFKEFITSMINTDNFKDDMLIDLVTPIYYKDWTLKIYLNTLINFEITLSDNTTQTTTKTVEWLSSFAQIDNRFHLENNKGKVLSESKYINYWAWLPFDLTVYTPYTNLDYKFFNESNINLKIDITSTHGKINRLCLSNGDEEVLIFNNNENVFVLKQTQNEDKVTIVKNKIDCFTGFYIKWINSLGGWNYWYFEDYVLSKTTKDTFEINNDFNNLEDTLSKVIQGGKFALNKIQTKQTFNSLLERENFMSLFESPKIYLFIGNYGQINNVNDWVEISLNPTTLNYQSSATEKIQFNLTFELPPLYTRTI